MAGATPTWYCQLMFEAADLTFIFTLCNLLLDWQVTLMHQEHQRIGINHVIILCSNDLIVKKVSPGHYITCTKQDRRASVL